MNNFYFNKEETHKLLNEIKSTFINNKNIIQKAINLDYEEWEYKIDFDILIHEIELIKNKEYLPVFSKEKVVDGFGKIVLISNQNPYLIFNFILSAIYTNNKVEIVLENKMLATNRTIIELLLKVLNENKVDENTVTYIELINKDEIISKLENYDLLYYFGNKFEYLNFIRRINIDSIFEEFGEINVYSDSKEFKKEIIEIDKWAYLNEIRVNIYNGNLQDDIKQINNLNTINKMAIIFSKDMNKIKRFVKEVKAQNVYVNISSIDEYIPETTLENLVYSKKVKW